MCLPMNGTFVPVPGAILGRKTVNNWLLYLHLGYKMTDNYIHISRFFQRGEWENWLPFYFK